MDINTTLSTLTSVAGLVRAVASGAIDAKLKAEAATLYDSILSMQQSIFSVQAQNHALLDETNSLKQKISEFDNWEKTASKYSLTEISSGVLLFSLKEDFTGTEPFHYICPNCYANQKWSILTKRQPDHRGTEYVCKNKECDAKYNDQTKKAPPVHIPAPKSYF